MANKNFEGVGFPKKESDKLLSEIKSPISISKKPMQHDRTKYVEIDILLKQNMKPRLSLYHNFDLRTN